MVRGSDPVSDEEVDVYVTGLIGAGFCFSQPDDYDMALQWAGRAYRAGLAGHRLSDVIAAARGGAGGVEPVPPTA